VEVIILLLLKQLLVMLGNLVVLETPPMDTIHGFKPLPMLDVIWLIVTKTILDLSVPHVIVMVKDV